MPSHGDGTRVIKSRESLTRFLVRLQSLLEATLDEADGPELNFPNCNISLVTTLIVAANRLLVIGSGFFETTEGQ